MPTSAQQQAEARLFAISLNHNPGQVEPPTAIVNAPRRVRNDDVNDAYVLPGHKHVEEREHDNKIHTEALFNSMS